MSKLIDIWTEEIKKLREKGRAVMSYNNCGPRENVGRPNKPEEASDSRDPISKWAVQSKSLGPMALDSEAALSLLVDCFGY